MKILALIGDESRHLYLLNRLMAEHEVLAISEEKGEQFNDKSFHQKSDLLGNYRNFLRASLDRQLPAFDEDELRRSGRVEFVPRASLKTDIYAEKIQKFQPDMTVVYGSGIVSPSLLNVGGSCILGSHQGLPQYYRGSGSNFFAFLEERAYLMGISLHRIDEGIDTGPVVAQFADAPAEHESFFEYSARLAYTTIEVVVQKARLFALSGTLPSYALFQQGRLFQRKDFTPEEVSKAFAMLELKPFSRWYKESKAKEQRVLLGGEIG